MAYLSPIKLRRTCPPFLWRDHWGMQAPRPSPSPVKVASSQAGLLEDSQPVGAPVTEQPRTQTPPSPSSAQRVPASQRLAAPVVVRQRSSGASTKSHSG